MNLINILIALLLVAILAIYIYASVKSIYTERQRLLQPIKITPKYRGIR